MTNELQELIDIVGDQALFAFAVFLRMSSFFAILPGFGERSVPIRIKLSLGAAMAIAVFPAVPIPPKMSDPIFLLISEILIGTILGLILRLFVLALQTAGAIAAQATSLAQLMGGNAAEPMPAIGHVLVISGLALAVLTGLHVKAVLFFILSYELFPIGQLPDPSMFGSWGIHRVATAFRLAFSLAAPFIILSVIYNVAMGAINKAMPQLMVAFVGAPLITAGGLVLLLFSAPLMLSAWISAMDAFLAAPLSGSQ